MSESDIHHPLFARFYLRMASSRKAKGEDEYRARMLEGLSGTVVEVGAGSGLNFPLYPEEVERVIAVEPEPLLREAALDAGREAAVEIDVVAGIADELPLEDASCDAGIASLVLCSVPDQERALGELFRVIRPGGELRFYEHVVAHGRAAASLQRVADATFWPRVAGGCHVARDTGRAISSAGFVVEESDRFPFTPGAPVPPIPHILGRATRP